ncbi:MAG: hypothetical protein IBX55_08880 [Methyloprofundus sp.]|nr:hypothetical protein [Methyloprofundus sp.]
MSDKPQLVNSIQAALSNALANLHTSTIAQITAVNKTTIDCKPVINRVVNDVGYELPIFVDVPLITLQGAGSFIAMPYAVGDYCILFFTERCFDNWYDGQDFAPPAEYRMHDYSDAFALVGVNAKADSIANSDVIRISGDVLAEGNHVHTGNYTLTGDLTVNGNINCTGKLTVNSAIIGGIEFGTHTHSETGSTTGEPQ